MAPGANGYEGSCGPGFSLQGELRFVKPPAKTKRISRRGAEHAEKDKGTRFDLRLLPFVALQTFEILSACEDFIERSGFSPSPVLAFSACSAPLREILPSPLRALPPGAMPTALREGVRRYIPLPSTAPGPSKVVGQAASLPHGTGHANGKLAACPTSACLAPNVPGDSQQVSEGRVGCHAHGFAWACLRP